jgi:hypothetical protein
MTSKNAGGKTLSNIHIVTAVTLNKSVMLEGSTDFTHKRAKTLHIRIMAIRTSFGKSVHKHNGKI